MDEVQRNSFYQLPKFLFSEEFKSLGNDARVLYSLLRDRHQLSIKNQWLNEKGEVYLIFSRENMCEMLQLSKPTIIKAMNDLKKHNLIQEERLGQGKANRIYLLAVCVTDTHQSMPENPDTIEKSKFFTSRNKEFLPQEVKNFYPNKTDINDIDRSQSQSHDMTSTIDTDFLTQDNTTRAKKGSSLNPQPSRKERKGEAKTQDDYIKYKSVLQENISYNQFSKWDKELVDELVDCVIDVICTKGETVRVNGEEKNRDMVISQYLKLNMHDIEHVLDRYKNQRHKITHVHNYLKTMLYTVKQENGHHYANAVRVDGLVK